MEQRISILLRYFPVIILLKVSFLKPWNTMILNIPPKSMNDVFEGVLLTTLAHTNH